MKKQIDEVMDLVEKYGHHVVKLNEAKSNADIANALAVTDETMNLIESKLRELLPVWQPIESACTKEGALIWAFNGEQAAMRYTETPDGNLWCWSDEVLSDIDPEPEQPSHWMPLPKAPE